MAVELVRRPRTPTVEALARLSTLVSPLTGIVRSVDEFLSTPDEPRLVSAACEPTSGESLLGAPLDHLEGGGGAARETRDVALAAALGEIAERYAAAYVPEERLLHATAAELGPACVDPRRFALFSDEQHAGRGFPFERFDRHAPVRWIEGFSLPDGAPAYLPAQLVYMSDRLGPGEPRIGYATSNGLACGPSLEEAVLTALLEVVERDAFMIVWYSRLSMPLLRWTSHDHLRELDELYFAPTGRRYAAVDLSAFHRLPTVLGVVRADGGGPPALGVGAGCAPTLEEAWLKALSEAFAVFGWARTIALTEPPRVFRPDFLDVESFSDHIRFHADPARARAAAFLDASPNRTDAHLVPPLEGDRPLAWLEALADRIAAAGSSAYAVDVTSPDVRAAGLRVVKAIAPELCQLDVPHAARYLGGERLYRAAHELGLRSTPLRAMDVNPCPHPFP